jgi:hypothetical protein
MSHRSRTAEQLLEVVAYLEARPAERVTYITPSQDFMHYVRGVTADLPEEATSRIVCQSARMFAERAERGRRWTVWIHPEATSLLTAWEREKFADAVAACRLRGLEVR